MDAKLSGHQRKTALRVSNVPDEDFNAAVESDDPPTVTALADLGVARQTVTDWLEPNGGTAKRFHLDIRQKLTKAGIGDPIKVTLGTLKLPTGRPAQPV